MEDTDGNIRLCSFKLCCKSLESICQNSDVMRFKLHEDELYGGFFDDDFWFNLFELSLVI